MTDLEKYIDAMKARAAVAADITGRSCFGNLIEHYDWEIKYYTENGDEASRKEVELKKELLSLAIGYMSDGLRRFICEPALDAYPEADGRRYV